MRINFLNHINRLPQQFLSENKTGLVFSKSVFVIAIFVLIITLAASSLNSFQVFASHTTTLLKSPDGSVLMAMTGGSPIQVDFYLNNFDDPDGLGAFELIISYDNRYLKIQDNDQDQIADPGIVEMGSFLTSSGKQTLCSDPRISNSSTDPNYDQLQFFCGTLGTSLSGPQGSGVLATISFAPQNSIGQTQIDISQSSLIDHTDSANIVLYTPTTTTIKVTKCAQLDAYQVVSAADIFKIVQAFGTVPGDPNWNENADLDANNSVSSSDIFISVSQFGQICP